MDYLFQYSSRFLFNVALGNEENIDKMMIACQKGPLFGRVDSLEFVIGRVSSFLPEVEDGVFIRV